MLACHCVIAKKIKKCLIKSVKVTALLKWVNQFFHSYGLSNL